jgi:regulator of sigma E protease
MSIVLFVVILALLIFVHELGHFLVAKRAGIRVDEFGIGFPPRLWSKKVGETVYSVNAFPVGGFVKIFGENPDEESIRGKDSSRSFVHKPKWQQAAVVSAGVIFNLLFAWMLLSIGFMAGVPYSVDDSYYGKRVEHAELTIISVAEHSPAFSSGLKSGDHILSLTAGKEVLQTQEMQLVQNFISAHEEIILTYERGDEVKTSVVHPVSGLMDGRRAIGISMDMTGILTLPVYDAVVMGFTTTLSLTKQTIIGLLDFFKQMIVGNADFSSVSGPVGIVRIVSDASVLGLVHLISLTALISINLAVINLFPFPALDGGRLFFIIIETIKRSPIKPVVTNAVNGIGFIILILLMVLITYSDIVKIVIG